MVELRHESALEYSCCRQTYHPSRAPADRVEATTAAWDIRQTIAIFLHTNPLASKSGAGRAGHTMYGPITEAAPWNALPQDDCTSDRKGTETLAAVPTQRRPVFFHRRCFFIRLKDHSTTRRGCLAAAHGSEPTDLLTTLATPLHSFSG